jgi:hypothetical protein
MTELVAHHAGSAARACSPPSKSGVLGWSERHHGRVPIYHEGDWFAVPLRSVGYAVGLLARDSGKGVLLGYFFGPRRSSVPALGELQDLHAEDACWIAKFGHLGVKGGEWPIIGRQPDWDRTQWPMPMFARYEELTGRWLAVRYDENNPNNLLSESLIDEAMGHRLPKDALGGAGSVEIRLTRLLDRE